MLQMREENIPHKLLAYRDIIVFVFKENSS